MRAGVVVEHGPTEQRLQRARARVHARAAGRGSRLTSARGMTARSAFLRQAGRMTAARGSDAVIRTEARALAAAGAADVLAGRAASRRSGLPLTSRGVREALLMLAGLTALALVAPLLAPYGTSEIAPAGPLHAPSPAQPPRHGRDRPRRVLARRCTGSARSWLAALAVIALGAAVGSLVGALAGAAGRVRRRRPHAPHRPLPRAARAGARDRGHRVARAEPAAHAHRAEHRVVAVVRADRPRARCARSRRARTPTPPAWPASSRSAPRRQATCCRRRSRRSS